MKLAQKLLLLPLFFTACDAIPEDNALIISRYRGHYVGPCNSWLTSPVSGRRYCSSPFLGFSTEAAYLAAKPAKADDSAFAGFDQKSPDERKAVLLAEGEKVYQGQCSACHQGTGAGLAGTFPPLVGNAVANAESPDAHIRTVLNGLSGKVIDGVSYSSAMAPFAAMLTDNQIAAVISFERSSWGNTGGLVEPGQVAALRGK